MSGASPRRPARAVGGLATLLLAAGCAYYNGVYNAKSATNSADDLLWRGNEGGALEQFRLAAEKAETVLVRHPDSRWQAEALYLAGRGAAYTGACDRAELRLAAYEATDDTDARRRARATIAASICALRGGRITTARTSLAPLVESADREVAREARLWAARAALAADDRDAAQRLFAGLGVQRADWELLAASIAAGDWVRAESLLVARAERADWREDVIRYERALWSAGHREGTWHVAEAYRIARLREPEQMRLRFALGELALRDSADSLARLAFEQTEALAARDTIMRREARARLGLLALATRDTLAVIDSIVQATARRAPGSIVTTRLVNGLALYRLLRAVEDPTGAAVFLAGEVARDSLRAPRFAASTFRSVTDAANAAGRTPMLAPRALYAAALLVPDSAAAWRAEILRDYPDSPTAAWLRGAASLGPQSIAQLDALVRVRWEATTRAFADSLRARQSREGTTGRGGGGGTP